uniref:Uncharacterized protein n=1 Tax=Romanomermis culicivorax TaxID=13658 RepID=A0A915L302_ROMCU
MSREKKRRENDEESWRKEIEKLDVSYSSGAASLDMARANEMSQQGVPMSDLNAMIQAQQQQLLYLPPNYPGLPIVGDYCLSHPLFSGQILPNTVVPPLAHFQVLQFPIMQFPPGQAPYYHQFLVPPGLQMPPPTIIPPIRNVQSEERMDIPGTSTSMQPPQRPPSRGNLDYISPLKRETGIGLPGRDHSGHRQK